MPSQSMNRGAHQPGALDLRQLIQDGEPVKDAHHSSFARFIEVIAGNGHGHIQLVTHSFLLAFHFFTLFAGPSCRFVFRSAIGGCCYVMTTLCADATKGESQKHQQIPQFGAAK